MEAILFLTVRKLTFSLIAPFLADSLSELAQKAALLWSVRHWLWMDFQHRATMGEFTHTTKDFSSRLSMQFQENFLALLGKREP